MGETGLQIVFALLVSIAAVVMYREIGPFWDVTSDLLSYVCGWMIVLCVIALLLHDHGLLPTGESQVVASVMLILVFGLIILVAISAQVYYNRTATSVTHSGRFTKSMMPTGRMSVSRTPKNVPNLPNIGEDDSASNARKAPAAASDGSSQSSMLKKNHKS